MNNRSASDAIGAAKTISGCDSTIFIFEVIVEDESLQSTPQIDVIFYVEFRSYSSREVQHCAISGMDRFRKSFAHANISKHLMLSPSLFN